MSDHVTRDRRLLVELSIQFNISRSQSLSDPFVRLSVMERKASDILSDQWRTAMVFYIHGYSYNG
jgi:hypothetical protein